MILKLIAILLFAASPAAAQSATPTISVAGADKPIASGATITVTTSNSAAMPADWVSISTKGSAAGTGVAWSYLNGGQTIPTRAYPTATLTFTAPSKEGDWEARLLKNNGSQIIAMAPFSIGTAIPPSSGGGTQGPAGPVGPMGPAGPTGPVGPAGPMGPAGTAGKDFDPKLSYCPTPPVFNSVAPAGSNCYDDNKAYLSNGKYFGFIPITKSGW